MSKSFACDLALDVERTVMSRANRTLTLFRMAVRSLEGFGT